MSDKRFISVFRSTKKADTYIYVQRGQEWDELPEALRAIFGKPVHAMDLVMTTERKLARTTGKEVLEAIADKGFFVQMPEEQSGYVVAFKERSRDRSE